MLMLTATMMVSCMKETIEPAGTMYSMDNQRQGSVYVSQMTSLYTTCYDTATPVNSNCTGYATEINSYTLYDFTAITDDGAKMHFKVKDKNSGSVANGDTLVMTYAVYTPACGADSVILRTNHTLPTFNVTTGVTRTEIVTLNYGDCVLPLNGLSGHISIVWHQ